MTETIRAIPFGDGAVAAKICPIENRGMALIFYALDPPKECGAEVLESDKKMLLPEMFNSLLFQNEKSVDVVMEWLQHVRNKFDKEIKCN